MDVEGEEYHSGGSREGPSPAESGSGRKNGKVRPGVWLMARLTPLQVKSERMLLRIL
mgnify:CR=1 FL=1